MNNTLSILRPNIISRACACPSTAIDFAAADEGERNPDLGPPDEAPLPERSSIACSCPSPITSAAGRARAPANASRPKAKIARAFFASFHAYACIMQRYETALFAVLLRHAAPSGSGRDGILRRSARGQRSPRDAIYNPPGSQNSAGSSDHGSRTAPRHRPNDGHAYAGADEEEQARGGLHRRRSARAKMAPYSVRGSHLPPASPEMGVGTGDGRATTGACRSVSAKETCVSRRKCLLGRGKRLRAAEPTPSRAHHRYKTPDHLGLLDADTAFASVS
jgi:hypothetical protein